MQPPANTSAPILCASSVDQLFIEVLSKMDHNASAKQVLMVFGMWVVAIAAKFMLKRGVRRLCGEKKKNKREGEVLVV